MHILSMRIEHMHVLNKDTYFDGILFCMHACKIGYHQSKGLRYDKNRTKEK